MNPSRAALALVTLCCASGLYLLLAGQASATEWIADAIVAPLAILFALDLRRVATRPMRVRPRGLGALLRGAAALPEDLFRVGRALLAACLSRRAGRLLQPAFRFGDDGADEAGRRAATGLALSLAPNAYLVDFDRDGPALLHQLDPAPPSPDPEWPP